MVEQQVLGRFRSSGLGDGSKQGIVVSGGEQQGDGVIHADLRYVGRVPGKEKGRRTAALRLGRKHPRRGSSKGLLQCTIWLLAPSGPTVRRITPGLSRLCWQECHRCAIGL